MEFTGQYDFLSNFYPCEIRYNGRTYPSVENAYQAEKSADDAAKDAFTTNGCYSPSQAREAGKRLNPVSGWSVIKYKVMADLVSIKFHDNPELAKRLIRTGEDPIVEDNTWGDTDWGRCNGVGENHLGRILMDVRFNLCREYGIPQSPRWEPVMSGNSLSAARCSTCGMKVETAEYRGWAKTYRYCPGCGRKMQMEE